MLRGASGSVCHGGPPQQTRDLPDAVRSHQSDTFFANASVLSSVAGDCASRSNPTHACNGEFVGEFAVLPSHVRRRLLGRSGYCSAAVTWLFAALGAAQLRDRAA